MRVVSRFRRRDVLMLAPLATPPSPSARRRRPSTTHAVHITFTFPFARLVGTEDDRVPDVASLLQQSLAQAAVAGIVPGGNARRVGRAASALVVAAPLVTCPTAPRWRRAANSTCAPATSRAASPPCPGGWPLPRQVQRGAHALACSRRCWRAAVRTTASSRRPCRTEGTSTPARPGRVA